MRLHELLVSASFLLAWFKSSSCTENHNYDCQQQQQLLLQGQGMLRSLTPLQLRMMHHQIMHSL
jgi:hypothetical protein